MLNSKVNKQRRRRQRQKARRIDLGDLRSRACVLWLRFRVNTEMLERFDMELWARQEREAREQRDRESEEDPIFEALRKAAEQGNSSAMSGLGDCFRFGFMGVVMNLTTALEWYTKALDAGHEDAQDDIDEINALLDEERIYDNEDVRCCESISISN